MHKSNPTKAEKLFSEISALQSPLPKESTNQPLATERRIRRHHRGGIRSNRTILDPVREEESIYTDTGQDGSTNTRRGQRSRRPGSHVPASIILDDLDIAGDIDLGGNLDLGEISVKDLIDQTSRVSGRHPARYQSDDDEDDQILSSMINPSSPVGGRLSGLGSLNDLENGIGSDPTGTSQLARQPRRRRLKVPVRTHLILILI